jgi:hypothetical protein
MCENNINSPLNISPCLICPRAFNAFDIFGVRQSHLGKIAMPFTNRRLDSRNLRQRHPISRVLRNTLNESTLAVPALLPIFGIIFEASLLSIFRGERAQALRLQCSAMQDAYHSSFLPGLRSYFHPLYQTILPS